MESASLPPSLTEVTHVGPCARRVRFSQPLKLSFWWAHGCASRQQHRPLAFLRESSQKGSAASEMCFEGRISF